MPWFQEDGRELAAAQIAAPDVREAARAHMDRHEVLRMSLEPVQLGVPLHQQPYAAGLAQLSEQAEG
jgi:hypothetical protein